MMRKLSFRDKNYDSVMHPKEIRSLLLSPSVAPSIPQSLPLSVPPVPDSLSVFSPNFLTSRLSPAISSSFPPPPRPPFLFPSNLPSLLSSELHSGHLYRNVKSLQTSQVAHLAGAYPGFRSIKRLGVFQLPPRWDASPSQGYPQY